MPAPPASTRTSAKRRFVGSRKGHAVPHMAQLESPAVARSYFGTDGVRGIVGEFVTADLVERLGKASALWSGRGRVFIGRDTRASGQELAEAFARGGASAGGGAGLGGGGPTPPGGLLPRALRVAP